MTGRISNLATFKILAIFLISGRFVSDLLPLFEDDWTMGKTSGANPGFEEDTQSVFSDGVDASPRKTSYFRARLADGGRLVIPSDLRKALELAIGDEVVMTVHDGVLEVVPQVRAIRRVQEDLAQFKRPGPDIVDVFLKERRAENQMDDMPDDETYWTKKGNLD